MKKLFLSITIILLINIIYLYAQNELVYSSYSRKVRILGLIFDSQTRLKLSIGTKGTYGFFKYNSLLRLKFLKNGKYEYKPKKNKIILYSKKGRRYQILRINKQHILLHNIIPFILRVEYHPY